MTLALRAQPGLRTVGALVVLTACVQVAYPLTSGSWRTTVTVLVVGLAAAAALVHAAVTRGPRTVLVLALVAVGGFAVELVGTHTGFPFGRYTYSASLGTRVAGVPIMVAFAWIMLAWPAALVAARMCHGVAARVLVGAWALASWDLFLDPQMVAAGHWRWTRPTPHLPRVPTVPLTDYAGWLAVALVVSAALQYALSRAEPVALRCDSAPIAFYVWTWASSGLALAAFLGLPAAALWGTAGMGLVAVPALVRLPVARSVRGRPG